MLETLKKRLANYQPPQNLHVTRRASVLVPLFEQEGEIYVLLTRRSQALRSHSGQVSFPGGKEDPTDRNAWDVALRESFEEIGLARSQVTRLGQIDQIISVNALLVTPFVALIPADFRPELNLDEIESVFSVPLYFFMEESHHEATEIRHGSRWLAHHFYYNDYDIWGLTAMLLIRLLEVGLGHIPSYGVHHPHSVPWMEFAQRFRDDHSL